MFNSSRVLDRLYFNHFLSHEPAISFDLDSFYYSTEKVDGATVLKMDLPGVKKQDLEITLDDDGLTLKWKRHNKDYSYFIPLQNPSDKSTATLEDGVLVITSPDVKPQKKKIEVK